MKNFAFLLVLFASAALFAAPSATVTSFTQDTDTKRMKVVYSLTEAAVVTADIFTGTGESKAELEGDFEGDVNRLLAAGSHTLYWRPVDDVAGSFAAGDLTVDLSVYATDDPPLYMVVNVEDNTKPTMYYATEADVPGTPMSAIYKSTRMLFRRIPAKGKTCRSKTFAADYYMAVYETTTSQFHLLKNKTDSFEWKCNAPSDQPGFYQESFPAQTACGHIRGSGNWSDPHAEPPAGGCLVSNIWARYTCKMDLPLEAEWEFAARAGETGAIWAGMNLDDVAWTTNNSKCASFTFGSTTYTYAPHCVGLKQPNPWGLYDTLGNLAEWCIDPCGTNKETTRPLRGGGHATHPESVTLNHRWENSTGNSSITTGNDGSRTVYNGGFRFMAPAVAVQ